MSENEYTDKDGVTYVAEKEPPLKACLGCAHDSDHPGSTEGCLDAPFCTSSGRDDGRSIIWVVKK